MLKSSRSKKLFQHALDLTPTIATIPPTLWERVANDVARGSPQLSGPSRTRESAAAHRKFGSNVAW